MKKKIFHRGNYLYYDKTHMLYSPIFPEFTTVFYVCVAQWSCYPSLCCLRITYQRNVKKVMSL